MNVQNVAGTVTLVLLVGIACGQEMLTEQVHSDVVQPTGADEPIVTLGPVVPRAEGGSSVANGSESIGRLPFGQIRGARVVANWTNLGGNAQRNGQSAGIGPTADELLWENDDDFSIISWHPVILDDRVVAIRQAAFPGQTAGDTLVAWDLDTGAELWRVVVPYGGDSSLEWIAHVMGANDGRVYAARGGSDRFTPVYAFDAETGDLLWFSEHHTGASPQENAIFAPNGDLIVGDYLQLARIDANDGSTVWEISRSCAVSGNCAAALGIDGVFIDQPVPGGQSIAKFDLATGAFLYDTDWSLMPGLTVQNTPFVSPDGTKVYLARTQNNEITDFLYAFEDTGSELAELWSRAMRWTTSHEHGIADDGSIYTFLPGDEFARLDPLTGDVIASAGVLSPIGSSLAPRTAVAADGTVYVSNGWANNPVLEGRIWAFNGDLSQNLFTLTLNRQNSGGPSLGSRGTLVVADRVSVRAYRVPGSECPGDLNGDGTTDQADLALLLASYGVDAGGDLNGDGVTDQLDLAILLADFGCGL